MADIKDYAATKAVDLAYMVLGGIFGTLLVLRFMGVDLAGLIALI